MSNHLCDKCGAQLSSDEIALFRKLFNRNAKKYWCLDCQAGYCGTSREGLQRVIDNYHRSGICSLFAKYDF